MRGGRIGLLTGGSNPLANSREYQHQDDEEGASLLPGETIELSEDVERADTSPEEPIQQPRRHRRLFERLFTPRRSKTLAISPLWPSIQDYPSLWLERKLPGRLQKTVVLSLFLGFWVVAFSVPLVANVITGQGAAGEEILHLDCTDTLWSRGNECGLDGVDCRPFLNSSFSFHCPANCAGVVLLNPHAVGPQDINYRPLVVGGPMYRGDSFLCSSAIHAGVVTDADGGCGIITRIGQQENFQSSKQNDIESISFDSYFPLSFTMSKEPEAKICGKDPRRTLLGVSTAFTIILSVSTNSPAVFFFPTFTGVFAEVALASDPPGVSKHSTTMLPELISDFAGRLLPAFFCAVVMYETCVRRTLHDLRGQLEKTVLWLGGCWIGALSNYTFDWIPISRLTKHDLEQQPGAKLALAIILVVILFIVLLQTYHFYLEARLRSLLAFYGIVLLAIVIGVSIPELELRLHHYIISLIFLPGTAIQTRPSLFYQGLLVGLFINGIARWNFDSVLQTTEALRGSDGEIGSLLPTILSPNISIGPEMSSISLTWAAPPSSSHMEGVSILVNDVERYRHYLADSPISENVFVWNRSSSSMQQSEYFRFAYLQDGKSLDYTSASMWGANGSWITEV